MQALELLPRVRDATSRFVCRYTQVHTHTHVVHRYDLVPMCFIILSPCWFFLSIVWGCNTYLQNATSAKDLHRLLCWVPVIELVHGVLSLLNYVSCPWTTTLSLIYATFWAVVTILKEPVLLLCLLLVAKGWCITRHTLQRREVCVAGVLLALLYASVSVQLSLQTIYSLVPMTMMYIAMIVDIALSIMANLRILKAQLLALRSLGVDPCTTPAYTKYKMFMRLAVLTAFYACCEVTVHVCFTTTGLSKRFWLFTLVHQLVELTIAFCIGYTFRAQPFNVLFTQVQQVAEELADQMLPTITTVEIKPDDLTGQGLVAWRPNLDFTAAQSEPQLPATIIVLNPGDTELTQARCPVRSSTCVPRDARARHPSTSWNLGGSARSLPHQMQPQMEMGPSLTRVEMSLSEDARTAVATLAPA